MQRRERISILTLQYDLNYELQNELHKKILLYRYYKD